MLCLSVLFVAVDAATECGSFDNDGFSMADIFVMATTLFDDDTFSIVGLLISFFKLSINRPRLLIY